MFFENLFLFFALSIGFVACILTFYFFITYLLSGFGKYPPFVCSLGSARKTVILEAEKILQKMPSPVNVADLGCGSGSLLIPLAKKFPQHNFIGYDWDIVPYLIAKFRSRKIPNIRLYRRNFMKENCDDIQLVLCYTSPTLKEPLGEKLFSDLPEGSFVISETFELDYLTLLDTIQTNTFKIPIKVFLYQKKTKK